MALDAYSLCPGGTGKKIKFCCPDFISELDKIDRMLEGEQFVACLQHIDQLEQKGQSRACLMAIKSELLRMTNDVQRAPAYVADFVERFPQNPVAWSESALLAAATEGSRAAMGKLQRAIELCDGRIHSRVYEAAFHIANALVQEGHWMAGRALLQFLTALNAEDQEPMERLIYLNGSPDVPLLLKSDPAVPRCPPDAPWRASFEAALAPLKKGQWQATADSLAALAIEAPDSPTVWMNLAVVRGWLADEAGARDAFEKFAALPAALEDAVEAKTIAMLTSESPLGDDIDIVRWSWPVRDPQRLHESLLSDRRFIPLPVDSSTWPADDGPPPRMAALLLDRLLPDGDEGLSLDRLPCLVGQLLLFGRETDRPARLELVNLSRTDADHAGEILRQVGGDALEPAPEETVVTKISASHELISRRRVGPRGMARAKLAPLLAEDFRDVILSRWPDRPLGVLGGRSLRQAAGDPTARINVLAAILVVQQWSNRFESEFDFNELRSQLGLPTLGPVQPEPGRVMSTPLVRLVRVEAEKLSDADLVMAMQRALLYHIWDAARKFARVVVDRPSLAQRPERMEAYRTLAQTATSLEEGLASIDRGRREALANGQSCAAWDLLELSYRFRNGGDLEPAMQLIEHIETRHFNEQGVAQTLTQILIQVGLLNPDGTPAVPPDRHAPAKAAPPAAEAQKLWTPGGESSGSGGKLWTPGS